MSGLRCAGNWITGKPPAAGRRLFVRRFFDDGGIPYHAGGTGRTVFPVHARHPVSRLCRPDGGLAVLLLPRRRAAYPCRKPFAAVMDGLLRRGQAGAADGALSPWDTLLAVAQPVPHRRSCAAGQPDAGRTVGDVFPSKPAAHGRRCFRGRPVRALQSCPRPDREGGAGCHRPPPRIGGRRSTRPA